MNNLKMTFEKIISKENRWIFIGAIIIGLILGLTFSGGSEKTSSINPEGEIGEDHEHSKNQIWTCSMHPQIQQPKSGKCPLCGMDLIPVSSEAEEVGYNQLKLSENAIKLAEIQTAPVERREVSKVIRMSGKIAFNETNVANITSRIPGRIDNIYVNYTGTEIKKGERMVNLYSPELITAQQELLQSLKSLQISRTPELKENALKIVEASREKLILWGLTKNQIREFENRNNTVNHIVIYSPMNGIVVRKDAFEGMYVNTGTKLYTIANLQDLWVQLDAYESDISWIKTGQSVEFETEAYPGKAFKGKVTFIDPVINPRTRTIKVRVNIKNHDLKLKPEMFVSAKVYADIEPTKKGEDHILPLVIPSSSPLVTGKRAIVYVAVPGKKGVFEGRNIVLGSLADEYYIVKDGLNEGEIVVVNGAFKIDSDLQIQAKSSMMNPEGGGPMPGHNHGDSSVNMVKKDEKPVVPSGNIPASFRASIDKITELYFQIQDELSRDQLDKAKAAGKDLLGNLDLADMKLLKGDTHMEWMKIEKVIRNGAERIASAADIDSARGSLEIITKPIIRTLKYFGSKEKTFYKFHCPMAFDNKGAYWLQKGQDVRNPYFGESMLTCKDSVEKISVGKNKQ